MKTKAAQGKFAVSFNCAIGDYVCGDERVSSVDYVGDDIKELAREVILSDPDFPMQFTLSSENDKVVGVFHHVDDDPEDIYVAVAVMVPRACL